MKKLLTYRLAKNHKTRIFASLKSRFPIFEIIEIFYQSIPLRDLEESEIPIKAPERNNTEFSVSDYDV